MRGSFPPLTVEKSPSLVHSAFIAIFRSPAFSPDIAFFSDTLCLGDRRMFCVFNLIIQLKSISAHPQWLSLNNPHSVFGKQSPSSTASYTVCLTLKQWLSHPVTSRVPYFQDFMIIWKIFIYRIQGKIWSLLLADETINTSCLIKWHSENTLILDKMEA